MDEQTIICPQCGHQIPLTEAFTHRIEERLRLEFDGERARLAKQWETKLATERKKLEEQLRKQAEESLAVELKDLKQQLQEKAKLLEEAQQQELSLRKRQRELDEREKAQELEIERKLDEERKKLDEEMKRFREEATTKAEEAHRDAVAKADEERRLKDREKELQMEAMRKQIEELKRKAEQGSQHAQGEALELELEDLLTSTFRFDRIAPVAKGKRGGDLLQEVISQTGQPCGSILWELKRTKHWSDAWVQKLKDDQQQAKADLAVIVSSNLPDGVRGLGNKEGVWIVDSPSATGLATVLRANLIQLAQARVALEGKNEKTEIMYSYFSGPEFRQRVEAIVGSFVSMKKGLDEERRSTERLWAKREKEIERVIRNMAGMYGDLQGIIGSSLPAVKLLELPSGEE